MSDQPAIAATGGAPPGALPLVGALDLALERCRRLGEVEAELARVMRMVRAEVGIEACTAARRAAPHGAWVDEGAAAVLVEHVRVEAVGGEWVVLATHLQAGPRPEVTYDFTCLSGLRQALETCAQHARRRAADRRRTAASRARARLIAEALDGALRLTPVGGSTP